VQVQRFAPWREYTAQYAAFVGAGSLSMTCWRQRIYNLGATSTTAEGSDYLPYRFTEAQPVVTWATSASWDHAGDTTAHVAGRRQRLVAGTGSDLDGNPRPNHPRL
jgi:hypothetical protein